MNVASYMIPDSTVIYRLPMRYLTHTIAAGQRKKRAAGAKSLKIPEILDDGIASGVSLRHLDRIAPVIHGYAGHNDSRLFYVK